MHDIPVAVLRQTELARGDIPAAIRASLVVNNVGMLVAMALAPVGYAMLPVSGVLGACALLIMAIGAVGVGRFHPHAARWRAPTLRS